MVIKSTPADFIFYTQAYADNCAVLREQLMSSGTKFGIPPQGH
jgi:hypothetical protein